VANGTVLLTGASGLLGTWLRRTAPGGVEVVGVTHRSRLRDSREVVADLRDPHAAVATVRQVRPSLVIHAAYARDEVTIVDATRNVVDAAREVDADVLYVSSDAVFSGDGLPRHEHASPDPVWDYGRWKARAERIVAGGVETSTIVRLPLIVSLDPEDHAVTRIRQGAAPDAPTSWFEDELRQPAAASELAEALWRIALLDPGDRAGAWHLPGPESLSRYQIAQRVVAALGLSTDAVTAERTPLSSDRPRHIDLRGGRASVCINWSPAKVLC
jgi:dTDP-4-dehydrorhamnose reductase